VGGYNCDEDMKKIFELESTNFVDFSEIKEYTRTGKSVVPHDYQKMIDEIKPILKLYVCNDYLKDNYGKRISLKKGYFWNDNPTEDDFKDNNEIKGELDRLLKKNEVKLNHYNAYPSFITSNTTIQAIINGYEKKNVNLYYNWLNDKITKLKAKKEIYRDGTITAYNRHKDKKLNLDVVDDATIDKIIKEYSRSKDDPNYYILGTTVDTMYNQMNLYLETNQLIDKYNAELVKFTNDHKPLISNDHKPLISNDHKPLISNDDKTPISFGGKKSRKVKRNKKTKKSKISKSKISKSKKYYKYIF
jgi:hypothetical protein